jgi:hypothetical protein
MTGSFAALSLHFEQRRLSRGSSQRALGQDGFF